MPNVYKHHLQGWQAPLAWCDLQARAILLPMLSFRDRLLWALDRANVSQSELARRLGISPASVNQWLAKDVEQRTDPKHANKVKAAKHLGVPPMWLVFGQEELRRKDGAATIHPQIERGYSVPLISALEAINGAVIKPDAPLVYARFPTGPNAYAVDLPDNSNAPKYPVGTCWILDPDKAAVPGRMVLGAYGTAQRPVFGRLRQEVAGTSVITIIQPLNSDWPPARSDMEPLEIVATLTQSIRAED